ncbi:MAG: glycosyl hydrolase family 18, partial [Lachnospiraceae bacterium]|nr:glycosyl hydrolase family 18 [Lachnospiraceae bacterium]
MKKKTSPILAVLLLVVVVVLMLAGKAVIERYIPSKEKADLKEYFQLAEAEDTAIIVDNEKQETTAKLVAGKIYVEYQFL